VATARQAADAAVQILRLFEADRKKVRTRVCRRALAFSHLRRWLRKSSAGKPSKSARKNLPRSVASSGVGERTMPKKTKAVCVGGKPITPISTKERKEIAKRIKKERQKPRNLYPRSSRQGRGLHQPYRHGRHSIRQCSLHGRNELFDTLCLEHFRCGGGPQRLEVRGLELNSRVHKTDSEVRNAGEWRGQVSVRVSQEQRTKLEKKVFVSEPAMRVIAEAGGRPARRKPASVLVSLQRDCTTRRSLTTDGDITCYVAGH